MYIYIHLYTYICIRMHMYMAVCIRMYIHIGAEHVVRVVLPSGTAGMVALKVSLYDLFPGLPATKVLLAAIDKKVSCAESQGT